MDCKRTSTDCVKLKVKREITEENYICEVETDCCNNRYKNEVCRSTPVKLEMEDVEVTQTTSEANSEETFATKTEEHVLANPGEHVDDKIDNFRSHRSLSGGENIEMKREECGSEITMILRDVSERIEQDYTCHAIDVNIQDDLHIDVMPNESIKIEIEECDLSQALIDTDTSENAEQNKSIHHQVDTDLPCSTEDTFNVEKDHMIMKCNKLSYKCYFCDYNTITQANLAQHISNEHNVNQSRLKCYHCDYSSVNKILLTRHIMLYHGKKELFKCGQCDYSNEHRRDLLLHVMRVHTKEKPLKCDQCDYDVVTISELKSHILFKHFKGNLFKCDRCDYICKVKKRFNQHMVFKHKEKRMKCDFCSYYAETKSILNEHMIFVHGKE